MLLLERKTVKAQELADLFEVSKRTIYRDADSLAKAGLPIVTTSGPAGGIGLMEEYKVSKHLFTQQDLVSLLTSLSGMQQTLPEQSFKQALNKLQGLLPKEAYQEFEKQRQAMSIDLVGWRPDSRVGEYLALIRQAIDRSLIVDVAYYSGNKQASTRSVEPYRLLHKGSNWYLQGYCLLREGVRTFRLSRIEALEVSKDSFIPREFIEELFQQDLRQRNALVEVTIRFTIEHKREIIGL